MINFVVCKYSKLEFLFFILFFWVFFWSCRESLICLISISGLLDLANAYCEPVLKKHCEQIIRHGISVNNVAMLYAAAIKYEAKVGRPLFNLQYGPLLS